jgi:hypothetical protein
MKLLKIEGVYPNFKFDGCEDCPMHDGEYSVCLLVGMIKNSYITKEITTSRLGPHEVREDCPLPDLSDNLKKEEPTKGLFKILGELHWRMG